MLAVCRRSRIIDVSNSVADSNTAADGMSRVGAPSNLVAVSKTRPTAKSAFKRACGSVTDSIVTLKYVRITYGRLKGARLNAPRNDIGVRLLSCGMRRTSACDCGGSIYFYIFTELGSLTSLLLIVVLFQRFSNISVK